MRFKVSLNGSQPRRSAQKVRSLGVGDRRRVAKKRTNANMVREGNAHKFIVKIK